MPTDSAWRVVYYEREDGKYPVVNFLDGLNRQERARALAAIDLLEEEGPNLRRPYADYLKDGIYELRVRVSKARYRIFYFFHDGQNIVLTHGFKKKVRQVPQTEINRARRYKEDWLGRDHEDP